MLHFAACSSPSACFSISAKADGSCQHQPEDPDKVYLSITGAVYWALDAIISSYPRGPARDSGCYDSKFYPRLENATKSVRDSWLNRTMRGEAAPQARTAHRHEATPPSTSPVSGLYRVNYLKVMYGVVSVSTSLNGASIENGVLELVTEAGSTFPGFPYNVWDLPVPVTAEEADGQHIFEPFKFKFALNKVANTAY